jgi:cation diffusion facilitator CzcD-associated flavoprotein CzcO
MIPIETVVIGAGPSGILAADKLLGSSALDARVFLLERSYGVGGIPGHYGSVPPNSPFKDLYAFVYDMRAEGLFSDEADEELAELLAEAKENPRLEHIAEAFKIIHHNLLERDPNFRMFDNAIANRIREREDGRYDVDVSIDGYNERFTVDVVVSAVGANPNGNPFSNVCNNEIRIEDALSDNSRTFSGRKVIVVGASHSGAIAVINAINQGAEAVEIWYRGDRPFKEHQIDGETKYFQFTGLNDPTKTDLRRALDSAGRRVTFKPSSEVKTGIFGNKYRDWAIVPAVGFSRPSIIFQRANGTEGELTHVLGGEYFGQCAPNLCYPSTDEPIPRVYGLGLAYPLPFREGFLPNTVEREGAGIVGIYFTHELSKMLVPDILQNLPGGR